MKSEQAAPSLVQPVGFFWDFDGLALFKCGRKSTLDYLFSMVSACSWSTDLSVLIALDAVSP